jgi:hypothetical protein
VVSLIYLAKPKCNIYSRTIIPPYKFLREKEKCHPRVVLNIILVLECIQSFGGNIIALCMFLLNFIKRLKKIVHKNNFEDVAFFIFSSS